MYVRTVWIDGFRHAILSDDDPYFVKNTKRRRPHSSATCASKPRKINSRLSQRDDLEGCIKNFNFVVRNERAKLTDSLAPNIETLNLADVDQESEDEFLVKANPQPLNEFDSCRSKFDNLSLNMRSSKSNRTARSDVKENTELSDRVLQWLDLAGKVDLLAPDNAERMSQPRHSWPEIQRRNHNLMKSKTTIDVRGKETTKIQSPKATDSAKTQQSTVIDRQEFYVPTSANTIENYARQSRNSRNTPRNETTKKDSPKIKTRDLRTNILETRQKVVSERSAVEKQYAELISKKLIPDLKGSKKQVHIFIPELPKKVGSNTTSRTESLLSQFSQLSHKT